MPRNKSAHFYCLRGNNLVKIIQRAVFSALSFLPGVVPEQPLSTSPVKRRTQSLSALPKDGDKNSPGKVVSVHQNIKILKIPFS